MVLAHSFVLVYKGRIAELVETGIRFREIGSERD